MSDRIPGSSWSNPIWYRNYRIFISAIGNGHDYSYVHDDYDGADDSKDNRCGVAKTIQAAKVEIDELESSHA